MSIVFLAAQAALLIWIIPSSAGFQHRAPILDLPSGSVDYYRGTIKRTDTVASIIPEIRVLNGTGPVCSYVITPLTAETQSETDHRNHTVHRRSVDGGPKKPTDRDSSSDIDESGEDDADEDQDDQSDTTTALPSGHSPIPFHVEVTDKSTGKAVIRLSERANLGCQDKEYAFKIAPRKCGSTGEVGDSVIVKLSIIDTNDHDPLFARLLYKTEVDEGRLYDVILKLEALDADCGHPYGEICRYEILDNDAGLFEISKTGELKIVKPLTYSITSKHTLSVVAEDCGKRRSKSATVEINVKAVCKIGLTTPTVRVEYAAEDGAKQLAPTVGIQLCDLDCPKIKDVQGTLQLGRLAGSDTGCDRERYDAKSLQATCGADALTVDLLPDPLKVHAIVEENSSMPIQPRLDQNSALSEHDFFHSTNVYAFDGSKNAIIVPPELTSPHVPDAFSLSFWMKHDRHREDHKSGHKIKENILCSSDDHRMNRHHFAIYIRNCKLELLIRREKPNKEGESEFQPAEWRWRIGQACDNQWHHYSFNMKFPQLDLYVDGKPIAQTEDNLEILDDWPMHAVNGMKSKLVVGACWHGGSAKMTQFFNGYLAEMTYLPGKVERPSVLPCTLQCKEQLDFTNLKRLKAGEEAVFNGDMSELTLKALNMSDYLELLRKIAYTNHKSYPTPGQRTITISTSFTCLGKKSEKINLPKKEIQVDVKRAADPVLTIEGAPAISHPQPALEQGVNIFSNVKMFLRGPTFGQATVDYCKIQTKPALNKEREYFSAPASLISSLNLDFEHVKDGLLLKGTEPTKAYEAVLLQIHYFNSHPSDYTQRVFTVRCSMLNGRIQSNELTVSMTIQAPLMRELKPSSDNQSGIGDRMDGAEEKMRPPTMTKTTPSNSAPAEAQASTGSITAAAADDDDGAIRTENVANIISDPTSPAAAAVVVETKPLPKAAKVRTSEKSSHSENTGNKTAASSMFEQRKNIPLLVLHDEPANRHHHLTLDKLAADAPRPSLGGPLPLLHQADLGDAYGNAGAVAGTGSAVAVVIVVCVGFLLLLIVVGIIKIRSTHRRMMARQHRRLHRGGDECGGETGMAPGDLAWDDAGMNITVNPMEVLKEQAETKGRHEDDYSDGSSDEEDDASYREDEECSDDEEDEHVLPHVSAAPGGRTSSTDSTNGTTGGLEWDDTTLSHSAAHANLRTQTYRV